MYYQSQTDAPFPIPFTLEHLLPELLSLAHKWLRLGEALSLDDDRLDEIYTNNETDEACLQEVLELYMARPDLDHSWEEVQEAVKKTGEELNWSTNRISCKLILLILTIDLLKPPFKDSLSTTYSCS